MPLPKVKGKKGFGLIMHELKTKGKKRPLKQRLAIAFSQSGYKPKKKH